MLTASSEDLAGLERDAPELVDAAAGGRTGIRLVRRLGEGAMSAVFLGTRDPEARWEGLSPLTPANVAIKLATPQAIHQLRSRGYVPSTLVQREALALSKVMARVPATEYVIRLFGSGETDVIVQDVVYRVPWMALEYVDGGALGASLRDRVRGGASGVDPIRAAQLASGLVSGVRVLHELGIVHRDLKPDNILVAGPPGGETPKIADCGIARIAGAAIGTVNAWTLAYSGPEQHFWPSEAERNPLVGEWTDVHGLAAVMWFVVAGEDWCRGERDEAYLARGQRRSLSTSRGLHQGFASKPALLERVDAVLAKGAAARVPGHVSSEGAARPAQIYTRRMPSYPPLERYATLDAFAADLLPLLADGT